MSTPFREATLSASDVRRILRRAAELAEHDPETATVERAMTRKELERAAADLGLPATAIARAIDGPADRAPQATQGRSRVLGGPTRILLEREVDGEPSEADREDLLEALNDATGNAGSMETVGKTIVWRTTVTNNRRNQRIVSVRLRSRDGRTRIVIEENLVGTAVGLFVGLGVGGGIGPMGAYIAAITKLGVLAAIFPLLWIPTMLLVARLIYASLARKRTRVAEDVMSRVTRASTHWSKTEARARVESAHSRVATSDAERLEEEDEAPSDARTKHL